MLGQINHIFDRKLVIATAKCQRAKQKLEDEN